MARQFVLRKEATPATVAYRIEYAEELNPQQYAAATGPGGPILVVAGAGTGKTRTLVYRLAYLVESGIAPERIALLTFTRRASREMLARASGLLDGRCQRVNGGTFHSFCLGVLRRHATKIGFPNNFTILDSSDSADVIDVIRGEMGLNKRDRFPRKRAIQSMFSSVVNRDTPLSEILEKDYAQFVPHGHDLEMLMRRFEGYKRAHGLMDYDDLLSRTLELFETDPNVLRVVAGNCEHVLVDEYQDTNRLQARLVKAFTSVHGNVMAVGDDAQSIYRFRGADFRNILAFPDEFPGTRVQKLEHNYRSTQRILDLANHIIVQARHKFDKRLFTERGEGDLPALVTAPDDRHESRFVCQMLLDLREQNVPLSDMAVLFRSGFNSYDLEVELNRRNIPFVKYGGLKLSEAAHVKDVVAHLRILENPQDAISWNRVLQLLEGIGPKTAGEIVSWVLEADGNPLELKDKPWSPRYAESLAALFALLRSMNTGKKTLGRQVEAVVEYYGPVLKRVYYEDYPKREQDLEHLISVVESFTDRGTLLSSLALDPIELSALDVDPLEQDEAPLVLSTIHSSKGLEFKAVFVIHALEGVLPSSYAVASDEEVDEELRLFYVAVTRAADHLFVTYPSVQYRRYQGQFLTSPSRFVADVPAKLLEPWSLVEENSVGLLPEAGL
jgi:ATP-dependent DNA helicase UvrD/PcrA